MISAERIIDRNSVVSNSTILHPKVHIHKIGEDDVVIGENNIVEEMCDIGSSSIGNGNLLEVGCIIQNSKIGSNNLFGIRCEVYNCQIGNNCSIMTSVKISDASIPDNTCVYLSEGSWRTKPVDTSLFSSIVEAYREKLSNVESPHCIAKNFK